MKLFIFGAQCAGKTTIVRSLATKTAMPIIEMDDEIMRLNNGVWPKDLKYKERVLDLQVYKLVTDIPNVIFLENHMSVEQTRKLKEAGFSVLLIEVRKDELLRRNRQRVQEEKYDDASKWIEMQLENIDELQKNHLIDSVIDGERPSDEVAQEIVEHWGMLTDKVS
jgi:adenylate kinase family enzyme